MMIPYWSRFGLGISLLFGLWAGQQAIAASADRRVEINIPARTLTLFDGQAPIKTYPVGVGRPQFPTPVGRYKVLRMVNNPGWENPYLPKGQVRIKPGAANPLGTRWIGFADYKGGEYGIHGTDNPKSVGLYSSHGCVRMKTSDAEDLFGQLQLGVPVTVVYEPVVIAPDKAQKTIHLNVYPDTYRKGKPSAAEVLKRIMQAHPQAQVDQAKLRWALNQAQARSVAVAKILPAAETEPLAKGERPPSPLTADVLEGPSSQDQAFVDDLDEVVFEAP